MVGYIYADGASAAAPAEIGLVILDKDGCLLDFNPTWLPGLRECAHRTAAEAGEPGLEPALLKAGGWIEDEAGGARIRWTDAARAAGEIAQAWIDAHR